MRTHCLTVPCSAMSSWQVWQTYWIPGVLDTVKGTLCTLGWGNNRAFPARKFSSQWLKTAVLLNHEWLNLNDLLNAATAGSLCGRKHKTQRQLFVPQFPLRLENLLTLKALKMLLWFRNHLLGIRPHLFFCTRTFHMPPCFCIKHSAFLCQSCSWGFCSSRSWCGWQAAAGVRLWKWCLTWSGSFHWLLSDTRFLHFLWS